MKTFCLVQPKSNSWSLQTQFLLPIRKWNKSQKAKCSSNDKPALSSKKQNMKITYLTVWRRHVHGNDGRTGTSAICRVGTFVRRPLEKIVLQRIVRCDSRLGVVIQHAQDKVLEFEIIWHGMARFSRSPTTGAAIFNAQDVVEFLCAREFILLAVFRLFQDIPINYIETKLNDGTLGTPKIFSFFRLQIFVRHETL